jgi:hypothetical protein
MKTMLTICLLVLATSVSAQYNLNIRDEGAFFAALTWQESKGDRHAVGDKHLRNHAYGTLQIRSMYLRDVNRIAGKNVQRTWGKKNLTLADMKDPAKAQWAARVYLSTYGREYQKHTGRAPTAEVYARIHNGGPDGWKQGKTLAYWRNVNSYMGVFSQVAKSDLVVSKRGRM